MLKKIFANIVSKSTKKPELQKVLLRGDYLVATDSYGLIEVNRNAFKDEPWVALEILRDRFKGEIFVKSEELDFEPHVLQVLPVEEKFSYPDYKPIIPTEEKLQKEYYSIAVNPELLMKMAKAINSTYADNSYSKVHVHIPREGFNKPMIIKRDDKMAVGVLMPLNK